MPRGKPTYQKPEICKECGGECCKSSPGCATPADFKPDIYNNLVEAFKSRKWVIDAWELSNGGKLHYVRPATIDSKRLHDYSWDYGPCVLLTETGCSLEPHKRPAGCRLLEPRTGQCKVHGVGKYNAARAWKPYEDLIHKAANEARESKER